MGNEEAVTLEIGEASIVIDVDGVHVELRGDDARDAKRLVARQLLSAIASLPERKEMHRQREMAQAQYDNRYAAADRANYGLGGIVAGDGAQELARAVNRTRY